jgi:hypothetical protein
MWPVDLRSLLGIVNAWPDRACVSPRPTPILMSQAAKIISLAAVLATPFACYYYVANHAWETTRLTCQPRNGVVQCNLLESVKPGKNRRVSIAKTQLSSVIVHERQTDDNTLEQINLITIDHKEIPLTTQWGGNATVQLRPHVDEISNFIADPCAQTLQVETHRDFLPALPVLVVYVVASGSLLKSAWLDAA